MNYNDNKCINILKGLSDCILTMILLNDNKLYSGDTAKPIKIYHCDNWILLYNLNRHLKCVKVYFN